MNGAANKIIERIKSIILVVLCLLTILLLCFFLTDKTFKDFSLDKFKLYEDYQAEPTVTIDDLLMPSRVEVGMDDSSFVVVNDNKQLYWETEEGKGVFDAFEKILNAEDGVLEEISAEQYENVKKYNCIRAIFDYYVPFGEFCDYYNISKPAGSETISEISEIACSWANDDSVFFCDEKNGQYYRVVFEGSIKSTFDYFDTQLAEENSTYFPMDYYLGDIAKGKKEILMPALFSSRAQTVSFERDFTRERENSVGELARKFFSDSFDFIRKIEEESGKIIYMYGYGQKTLVSDIDGTIEYKADIEGEAATYAYFATLERVLAFINNHGGFMMEDNQEISVYLKEAEKLHSEREAYRFAFGLLNGNKRVEYQEGNALEVEITGGQITYFKRNFISAKQSNEGDEREAYSAINTIALTYEDMYSAMKKEGYITVEGERRNQFNAVIDYITDVRSGYVRTDEENVIKPAWIVEMGGGTLTFYFDLYDGSLLNYSKKASD